MGWSSRSILTKECSSNFSDTKGNDVTGNHDTVSIFHQAQSTLGWIGSIRHTISTINLPNGGTTHVSDTGNVFFNPDLKLNNVLCVPSFNLNIMFINKLTNDLKCYVTLYPDSCVMQDLTTGKMIGLGKQFEGL